MDKAEGAFLTIGELSRELGVAQHILRYWESRFPQLRPLQRSGNRRYYRPADVAVVRRINRLLNEQGFTVRGAQRVLEGKAEEEVRADGVPPQAMGPGEPPRSPEGAGANSHGASAAPASPGTPSSQPELALGDLPVPRRARGQIDSSDIALLIARLTVIRENLREAIGA